MPLQQLPLQTMNVFPEHSLLLDEFRRICQLAEEECLGHPGRERISAIRPSTDFTTVLKALEETEEMRKIVSNGEPFPFESYPDVTGELKLLSIRNSVLSSQQVMMIYRIIHLAGLAFGFFKSREDRFRLLRAYLSDLQFDRTLPEAIEQVLDENGVVRSSASPELSRIRKNLSRKRIEAEQLYQQVIAKYRKSGWLGEGTESWRNGRRVVSVLAEQKRTARGIVHDISATGKTCYIEPEETIGINSLILQLEEEERLEIQRVLRELSELLRRYYTPISAYFDLLVTFDVIGAKARLALRMNAHLPYVLPEPRIDLQDARHPLLFLYHKASGRKVVPFTLLLDTNRRILIISGPNAGGKTVCMKTAGLLQLMLQSGFLPTADGNSRFGIFTQILVDIGDSQSLEFELSTYSSRLKHMRVFLQRASANSMFLIDEFGTGTDPALGGALAEAVLEELNHQKAIGIITTHYMNLKVLADRTPGIINGSMAFDSTKLEPLFRLEVGKPGSSYTFVVAERSGLPHRVINRARKKVKSNTLLLEELLNKVEKEKAEVNRLIELNKSQEKRLTELVNKYEKNIASQEHRQEQDTERIRQKELRLVQQMEDKLQRFVREWKMAKNKKTVLEKYDRNLKDKKDKLAVKEQQKLEEIVAYNRTHIRKGVEVRLRNGRVTGMVERIDGANVTVLFGAMRTKADIGNLVIVEQEAADKKKKSPDKPK